MSKETPSLASQLRTLRGDRSLREASRVCGLSRGAIDLYERGDRVPSTNALESLIGGYRVDESVARVLVLLRRAERPRPVERT
ncbi:MAG: helix-turn-helix domain-containing protein [bacterium]|nr:helix-turn-helix domain-containing protein [bacterium]